ncbi:hypothetical protein C436_01470 [Haloarcula marismortui ATCC 33800]|uniref:Uncharacterized protein n=1 Tax=Haloarcula marismortui ATCC 33800 TaxID=662476 RepID=M0K597_9EURY|nr:hypothetical protein C436_01470 [Haloarcula sinaiiensis ATCC 33800]
MKGAISVIFLIFPMRFCGKVIDSMEMPDLFATLFVKASSALIVVALMGPCPQRLCENVWDPIS